ncbi:MAG: LacI family DNA-binding transcriptional regulator [Verrucomicrobiota bacterium]|nr:LacI family DNA-binding transcriptional regulator [Verrucomicrobiota bacterium]
MPKKAKPQTRPTKVDSTTALAAYLGLSRWTISRVLNNHPGIKEDTRKRIFDAMQQLGFLPNPMARGLRGSKTGLIGVSFQELESPILAKKTSMLQLILRNEGFRAILELNGGYPEREEESIRHFLSLMCDGIVLVGSALTPESPIIEHIRQTGKPVVLIDPATSIDFASISLDRERAVALEIEHLYGLGHRQFALLGFDESVAYGAARMEGVRKTSTELKLKQKANFTSLRIIGRQGHNYEYGEILAEQYLGLSPRPTALIAVNDRVAIGAMKRLRDAGLKAPKDFSITGFDNLEVAAYTDPGLTTVDQQVDKMMTLAVQVLKRRIEEPATAIEHHSIQPVLLQRGSTGAVAAR